MSPKGGSRALAASSFALSSLRTGKRQFSAKLESRQFVSKSFVVSTKCFVVFPKSYLFFPACPGRQNGRPRHATKMGIKALVKKVYIKSSPAAARRFPPPREPRAEGPSDGAPRCSRTATPREPPAAGPSDGAPRCNRPTPSCPQAAHCQAVKAGRCKKMQAKPPRSLTFCLPLQHECGRSGPPGTA